MIEMAMWTRTYGRCGMPRLDDFIEVKNEYWTQVADTRYELRQNRSLSIVDQLGKEQKIERDFSQTSTECLFVLDRYDRIWKQLKIAWLVVSFDLEFYHDLIDTPRILFFWKFGHKLHINPRGHILDFLPLSFLPWSSRVSLNKWIQDAMYG